MLDRVQIQLSTEDLIMIMEEVSQATGCRSSNQTIDQATFFSIMEYSTWY